MREHTKTARHARNVLILLLASLLLFGCGSTAEERGLLFYQEHTLEAVCVLQKETGRCRFRVYRALPQEDGAGETFTITYLEPESLAGIVITGIGDQTYLQSDTVRIPVDRASVGELCAVLRFFSLPETSLTSLTPTKAGDTAFNCATFAADGDTYTVYLTASDGMPRRIEATGQHGSCTLDINSLTLQAESERPTT